jgi:hypothetical protein
MPQNVIMRQQFKPLHRSADLVQRVLDGVAPWQEGEDPIEARELKRTALIPETVRVHDTSKVIWAVHTAHASRQNELSPFVILDREPITNTLTVELEGTPDSPVVTRVYPADSNEYYIPPLPWMESADDADGGHEGCVEYWRTHAFIARRRARYGLMAPETRSATPPQWYAN